MNKLITVSFLVAMTGCALDIQPTIITSGSNEGGSSGTVDAGSDAPTVLDAGSVVDASNSDSFTDASDGSAVFDSSSASDSGNTNHDASTSSKMSVAWAVDYPDDVFNVVGQHPGSFTHVAVLVYDINLYSGTGVSPFWNTPGGGDVFQNGLTSTTMATKVHSLGLKYLASVAGGFEMNSSNQSIVNLIANPQSFITAMVAEGASKKYDGYVLDWEMGGGTPAINFPTYSTQMEAFLASFKSALNAQGMTLSVAIVPNDIHQSCTSYGNGVWDLTQLGNNVDYAMLEAYATSLGTPSNLCPANYTDPVGCDGLTSVFLPLANEVGLLCSMMKPGSVNIILNAYSGLTNPYAGQAISLLEAYGINSIGLFPQANSDGDAGDRYDIFESVDIEPAGTNWFVLLNQFMTN